MRSFKILVLGDGEHEIGNSEGELDPNDLPALPTLIHRLLNNPANVKYHCKLFKTIAKTRVSKQAASNIEALTSAFSRKTANAIAEAKLIGFDAVVILVDRDRESNVNRIQALVKGREPFEYLRDYPKCAVGTAIETFDAWMIVDGRAIRLAGGVADKSHPYPENLDKKEGSGDHPKDRAAEIFGSRTGLREKYKTVAANVDIELLKKCCPNGFLPFAEEITFRIGN